MFKYLQRIFGKSSSSYESLMNSRDSKGVFSEDTITQVVEKLRGITLPAYQITSTINPVPISPLMPVNSNWPTNKKGEPLLYKGMVQDSDLKICVFEHESGYKKDPGNLQIFVHQVTDWDQLEVLTPSNQKLIDTNQLIQTEILSLPIWEEIIHRFPEIHKLIVQLSPDHPWTLYKLAKQNLCTNPIEQQFKGYPQWVINDIDYRKIKEATFLIQLRDYSLNKAVYFFTIKEESLKFSQDL